MVKVLVVSGIVIVVFVVVLFGYVMCKMGSLCSRDEEARWAKLKKHDEEASVMKDEEVTDVL